MSDIAKLLEVATQTGVISQEQASSLGAALSGFSEQQLIWLAGFLSGVTTGSSLGAAAGATTGVSGQSTKLTVLYGSQTGNAEGVANRAAELAKSKGLQASAISMSDYNKSSLKKEENLMIVVSTHGEGDPPDTALDFYEFVHSKRAPKLKGLDYSVLALGDTSYEFFCKTGADFDSQLEKLGGNRITARVDCDLDYEDPAEEWLSKSLEVFEKKLENSGGATQGSGLLSPGLTLGATTTSKYDKKNPFPAEVLESINLNATGSAKETFHLEISLEDSGLSYEPGDALGVVPKNNPEVAKEICKILACKETETVTCAKQEMPLLEALTEKLEVTKLSKSLLEKYSELAGAQGLKDLLSDKKTLTKYIDGRDLRDLLRDFPSDSTKVQSIVDILRPLPPRLYSIASSPEAHEDEVHILVGAVRFESHGVAREGVCSTFLADRLEEDERLSVYIDSNKNFKLPSDPTAPIIMVGPGTGIAPFRSFIEHRGALGHSGKNWLFFGDQHFATDFLYQAEWLKYLDKGLLTNLDVAFSRDQEEKVYVQDRMREKQSELYSWIKEGAYFYVCGDQSKMAKDVDTALTEIIRDEGKMSQSEAEDFVKQLRKDKRYQRDVY